MVNADAAFSRRKAQMMASGFGYISSCVPDESVPVISTDSLDRKIKTILNVCGNECIPAIALTAKYVDEKAKTLK